MDRDEYRHEHLTFHNNRVIIFMTAAGALKRFALRDLLGTGGTETPPAIQDLISRLVYEARSENQIARWWKHMSDEDLDRQIEFWNN